jgi:hypothetical protein
MGRADLAPVPGSGCRNGAGLAAALALALSLGACDEGVSVAEASAAAKQRVTHSLGLSPDAALFTNVFVGESVDGSPVLCGTVEGRRPDGSKIPARRFIAATEPLRWVRFEPIVEDNLATDTSEYYVTWRSTCAEEEEVR